MVYIRKRGDAKEPHADGISGCSYKFNCKTYMVEDKSIIVIFFSYMALLTLIYGDRMEKTQEAHRVVEQEGLSYREAPFHAPLAPPCLHQWRFMPPIVSAFACGDIQEIPREKW